MKRILSWFLGIGMIFASLVPIAWAGHPDKNLGEDRPDTILWSNPSVGSAAVQALQGDIDGNGLPDLIFRGAVTRTNQSYVGIFFDATLSSLNNNGNGRSFSDADFMIVTKKRAPWASDVVVDHPMHWMAVDDLDQDGFDDILFGMPVFCKLDINCQGNLADRVEKGEVYLVLGKAIKEMRENLEKSWDFALKQPSFTFFGKDEGDRAGFSVATGDVNGDGRSDILIGAPSADGPNNAFPDGGEVYVITRMDWSKSSMVLSRSNVDLYLYGETTGKRYGNAVAVGNLNGDFDAETGDPINDIIVSPKLGPIKMIFGKNSERSLASADWVGNYAWAGRHPNLITADLDGDQITDLVSGEGGVYTYLTYGSESNIATQPDVVVWNSAHANDMLGFSNFISDFDGDGFQDLLILAPRTRGKYNQFTTFVGEAHIVWGQGTHLPSTINLATEPTHFALYGSDGTGTTGLSSKFAGSWWSSTYGYVFGMELEGGGNDTELFFGDPVKATYIYKIGPHPSGKGGGENRKIPREITP